jgi:hypothetical protein
MDPVKVKGRGSEREDAIHAACPFNVSATRFVYGISDLSVRRLSGKHISLGSYCYIRSIGERLHQEKERPGPYPMDGSFEL